MTSFYGLDIGAVRQLSSSLNQVSGEIQNLANQLTNQLGSTQWVGPDAQNSRNEWQGHQAALHNISQALSDASGLASRNADQQEQASNG